MRITRTVVKDGAFNNANLRHINLTAADMMFYKHKPFVMAWQRGESPAAVAKKLRMTVPAVITKANYLRKWIPLKKFNPGAMPPEVIKRLTALAKELAPKEGPIDYENLVQVWCTTKSRGEAARILGIPSRRLTDITTSLRRHIPELRRFHSTRDIPKLKELVRDLQS